MIQTIKPGQQMKVKGLNISSRQKDRIFSNHKFMVFHAAESVPQHHAFEQ